MENFKQFIENLSDGEATLFSMLLSMLVAVSLFSFKRLFGFITYKEADEINEKAIAKRLSEIETSINNIKKEMTKEFFKNSSGLIDKKINEYLDKNITIIAKNKMKDNKVFEDQAFNEIENKILFRLDSYLAKLPENALENLYNLQETKKIQEESSNILFSYVESERKNTSFLKSFMINLFVFVNIGLFALYLFIGSELSSYAALSLSGLYISLVGFIIYIFRASNSRTSVLLSIKEDYKKQLLAFDYVERVKKNKDLSENDLEFLKMILINRSEREKKINHPYEILLKGVSESNIQFKGGKIELGKSNKAPEE